MLLKNSKSSMERLLSKITYIHQAAGLQFFSVNEESLDSTSGISRRHKFFFVLSFTLVIGNLCGIGYVIHLRHQEQTKKAVKTGVIVTSIAYCAAIFVILVCILSSIFLRAKAKEIFKNCFRIANLLSLLNQVVDYSQFRNESKLLMGRVFFGFIFSNIALFVAMNHNTQSNFLTSGIVAVYPYFFITALVSYWTLLVRLIRENLRFIKGCLVHLNKKQKMFSLYPEPYSRDLRSRRAEETYNFIVKLKRIYVIIYESTSLVNEFLGIPICVFMAFVVLTNISGGYRVFLALQGDFPLQSIASKLNTN